MEDWCVGADAYIGPPHRIPSQMPLAAPFLSAAKEKAERTPSKPRFWNPFRGWSAACTGLLQLRESR